MGRFRRSLTLLWHLYGSGKDKNFTLSPSRPAANYWNYRCTLMIIMSLSRFRVCAHTHTHTQPPDQNGWRNVHRAAFIASFIAKLQRAPRNWTWFNYTHTVAAAATSRQICTKSERNLDKQTTCGIYLRESLGTCVLDSASRDWKLANLLPDQPEKSAKMVGSSSLIQ